MAGKHVLIVDDDTEFVKLYSLYLRNKGLEVSAVYSAGEALGALAELSPDVVVLDVMMEHFDSGFNVSKSIKDKYPDMPVILMTAIGEDKAQAVTAFLGAQGVEHGRRTRIPA